MSYGELCTVTDYYVEKRRRFKLLLWHGAPSYMTRQSTLLSQTQVAEVFRPQELIVMYPKAISICYSKLRVVKSNTSGDEW